MKHNINTKGFVPSHEMIINVGERIDRLEELCPYDTVILFYIEKLNSDYQFRIRLNCSHFSTEILNRSPAYDDGINSLFNDAYAKIQQWKNIRFNSSKIEKAV